MQRRQNLEEPPDDLLDERRDQPGSATDTFVGQEDIPSFDIERGGEHDDEQLVAIDINLGVLVRIQGVLNRKRVRS